jgi:hypothetical protein
LRIIKLDFDKLNVKLIYSLLVLFTMECNSCQNPLIRFSHTLNNGDEIKLVRCPEEGLYSVIENGKAVLPEEHEHELGETQTKLPSGDKVQLHSCDVCGFYATDENIIQ